MSLETLRQRAARTTDRLNIDSFAEAIGAAVLSFLGIWAGIALSLGIFTRLPSIGPRDPLGRDGLLLLGALGAVVALPAISIAVIIAYDRWQFRGYDVTPAVATILVSTVTYLSLLYWNGEWLASDSTLTLPLPIAEIFLFCLFIGFVGFGSTLGVVGFRAAIGTLNRRHLAVASVVILCTSLLGGGVIAVGYQLDDSQGANDDPLGEGVNSDQQFAYEQHEELSKWDSGYYGISGTAANISVSEETTSASMYACDEQPSPATLDSVAEQPAANTTVAPERLHLTLYEEPDGTPIYAQVRGEFNATGTHIDDYYRGGDPIVAGVDSESYYYSKGSIWMANVDSITVVSDYVNGDGEVQRYGARLCRPDV
jgi:hypothetical protein